MPKNKYSETDVRIVRSLSSVLGMTNSQIGMLLGIRRDTVKYLINERESVPRESYESQQKLIHWWLQRKLNNTEV